MVSEQLRNTSQEEEQSAEEIREIRTRIEEIYNSDEVKEEAHKLWLGEEVKSVKAESYPDSIQIDRDDYRFILTPPSLNREIGINRYNFTRVTSLQSVPLNRFSRELTEQVIIAENIIYIINESSYSRKFILGQEALDKVNEILDSFIPQD